MRRIPRRRLRLTLELLALNALLALGLWLELRSPSAANLTPQPAPAAADTTVEAPTSPTALIALRPRAAYEEIVARPLFHDDRRPIEPPEAPSPPTAAPVAAPVNFTLVGTVVTAQTTAALFLKPLAREVVQARVGEQVDGWTVESIAPDRVVLESGSATTELVLDRTSGGRGPQPVYRGRR